MKRWKLPVGLAGGLILSGILATAQAAVARPGTVNYSEGQVSLGGQALTPKSLGQVELAPNQVLETEQGKAEVLLTPGVFLRLGDNSQVRMISPGITDTRVELVRGEALLEAAQIEKENNITIVADGVSSEVEKHGLYRFTDHSAAVLDGKLKVHADDQSVEIGKGKRVEFASLKPEKFDRNAKDDLYRWSDLRSKYLAQANAASAQTIVVNNGYGWYGPGWYWNPWYSTWSFMPGSGYWASPFGYGFYSPGYWRVARPVTVIRPGRVIGPSRIGNRWAGRAGGFHSGGFRSGGRHR